MTYLLKDEDGEIYAAVSNVGPEDIKRAQVVVDAQIRGMEDEWEQDSIYQAAARALGLSNKHAESNAALVAGYLIEKCGGTELDFSIWRCGL